MPAPKDTIKYQEWKDKLSKAGMGRKHTLEELEKMSISQLGKRNHRWGKKNTLETRKKISEKLRGKPKSEEHRQRMSEANKGEKSHFFKGGITPINKRIRSSYKFKQWRKLVLERDDYRCFDCGLKQGEDGIIELKLHADHIYPFAYFPRLRFEINNGRTLCVNCHRGTNTWGNKIKQESYAIL